MRFFSDRPWLSRRTVTELAIVVAIFIAGYTAGARYREAFVAAGGSEEYGQAEFGAAVALACGHGFIDTGYAPTPAVRDFLLRKRDSITCADLPANLPPKRPNFTQGLYRYLWSAVALGWMLAGAISWKGPALTPVFATAYSLTLIAAYGVFRVGIGRVMSVAATLALMVSAVHLGFLPYFREYAKAPFILTLILVMARLAMKPLTWQRAVAFGVAFGAALGIGFGFRNDLLIVIPPWIAVVLLCVPGPMRANLKLKALCLAVSAVLFLVTAAPILSAYAGGSNSSHVVLLGFMSDADPHLGVAPALYDWGYQYHDGYAFRLIASFGYRQYGHWVGYLTPDYDRTGAAYIREIVLNWPADMVARAYASTLKILDELPFGAGSYIGATPFGITNATLLRFYDAQRVDVLQALHGAGVLIAALALAVISARQLRAAFALLLLLVYFGGYPALQFGPRHFFHLEFIGWWALAFVIDCSARALYRRVRLLWARGPSALPGTPFLQRLARVGVFVVGGVFLLTTPLLAFRSYQQHHLLDLFEHKYLGAEREPLAMARSATAAGRIRVDMPALWADRNTTENESTEYVVAEFSPSHCSVPRVSATFRYDGPSGADFTNTVAVRLVPGDEPTFVFFNGFYDYVTHFAAVELAAADVDCLVRVSRVKREQVPPVLLNATFTPHWKKSKLYQAIAAAESPNDGDDPFPNMYSDPTSLSLSRRRIDGLQPFTPWSPIDHRDGIVTSGGDPALVIRGNIPTPGTPFVLLRDRKLPAGGRVVATGRLLTGGMTFGIQKAGYWAQSVAITAPGRFVAEVSVPETADYTVVLSDLRLPDWAHMHLPKVLVQGLAVFPMFAYRDDLVIDTLGWLPPDGENSPGDRR